MKKQSKWERNKNRAIYIWQYYMGLSLREKAFVSLYNHINFKENQVRDFQTRGQHLNEYDKARAKYHSECSHRKGGYVSDRGIFERGTDDQYAVLKHQLPFGDWMIRCLRCGKKWVLPKRESFKTDFDFQMAYLQYKEAQRFPTRNTSSTGIQFQKFEKKKSLQATLKIVWSILKRDITLWSALRDNPENVTMRLT